MTAGGLVVLDHHRFGSATFPAYGEGNTLNMAESYAAADTATLRAMARGGGLPGADKMSHDELVDALRRAGLAEPGRQPIDTSLADPGDPGTHEGVYRGEGVGRRESRGGPGAETRS